MPINMAFVLTRPILTKMDAALAVTPREHLLVKLVVGILGLGIVIGAPLAALSLRYLGRRLPLFGFYALFVIAGSTPFFLDDIHLIVISRFFVGMAIAGIQLSAVTLAGETFDSVSRARWIGLMSGAGVSIAIVTTVAAGMLGSVEWRLPFLLHLLCIPLALMALRLREPGKAAIGTAKPRAPAQMRSTPLRLMTLAFIVGILGLLPAVYFAFRLRDVGVTRPVDIAMSFLAMSVPDAIIAYLFGYVRGRLSAQEIFAAGFALIAIGLAIVATASSHAVILVGMAFYGAHIGLLGPNLFNIASEDAEKRAGMVSLVTSAMFVSSLFGLVGLDSLFRQAGATGALLALSALATAMVALFAIQLVRVRLLAGG